MAEWFKAHAWKACVGNTTVSSNLTLSASLFFTGFRVKQFPSHVFAVGLSNQPVQRKRRAALPAVVLRIARGIYQLTAFRRNLIPFVAISSRVGSMRRQMAAARAMTFTSVVKDSITTSFL